MATVLLVPALVGCSVGDIRRRPPPPATTAPVAVATTSSAPPVIPFDELRVTQVAVPERYDRPHVEFVDAQHGYALFATCGGTPGGPHCPALLHATVDGGRSWRKLRHPRPLAANQQLYTAPGVLALWSESYGWYASTDGGARFTHSRTGPPPVWVGAQGRFQVVEGSGQVAEWDGRRLRPLAVQPPVPGLNTVAARDDQVLAAGIHAGRPYAAMSLDGGRTWRRQVVPAPDGEVSVLRAVADRFGLMWLIGDRPDRTMFPTLWRPGGPGWELVRAEGLPERVGSVAAVDGSMMAVNGPAGVGVIAGDRYHRVGWPLTPEHQLTVLADGTICARGPEGVVLGTGAVAERRWINVLLGRR